MRLSAPMEPDESTTKSTVLPARRSLTLARMSPDSIATAFPSCFLDFCLGAAARPVASKAMSFVFCVGIRLLT